MTIEQYESAIAIFRRALNAVTPEQITSATPCASFDIGQLVDHVIGTQRMVSAALQGEPINISDLDVARGEHAVAFDRAAADAVAELRRDDALQKVADLPFGTFTGEQLMGLATVDTFQHAWDLARATGQKADLDAELALSLMSVAVAHMAHAPRGDEPAPFGPEQVAPEGASPADRLAAFLGRVV